MPIAYNGVQLSHYVLESVEQLPVRDSQNPANDQALMTALDAFQRLACVGSSFRKLPSKAAKAAFWEKASEVVLPRITQQEHQAMGW